MLLRWKTLSVRLSRLGCFGGFLIAGFFAGNSRDGGMRLGLWVGGSHAPGIQYVGNVFGGTTLGACTGDCITGGDGITGTLSSVDESPMMAGCIEGTLCSDIGVG